MRPEGDGFIVVDLLGRSVTPVVDWLTAETTLDALGIGYLADPFELLLEDRTWMRVRIVEVSPTTVRVRKEDGGAIGGSRIEYTLPFPIGSRLRPYRAHTRR